MFLRKVSNDRHDITETEADFIAIKKTNFWLKRASAAMAKTKAICIININRSNKLIGRIEIEQESDILIADYIR